MGSGAPYPDRYVLKFLTMRGDSLKCDRLQAIW